MVICNSISVEIVIIWTVEKNKFIQKSQVSLWTSKVVGVIVTVQGAATTGHPVLYDIFYFVQYLLDIKAKFIPPVNYRSLTKQNGNYHQQAYFRRSQGAWMHFIKILIIIALIRNNDCTRFNRRGVFVSKKVKLRSSLPGLLYFTGKSYEK